MTEERRLERERLKKEAYESGVLMPDIMNPDSVIIKPETIARVKPTDGQMFAAGFKNPKQVENLAYIMKDIMQGDASLAKREEYSYLNFKQIKTALDWLMNSGFDTMLQSALLEKPYLLTFKDKPPTAEEFLTKKYIGSMADSVWLPVRKNFLNFFDPTQPFRSAVLNPAIGSGKSTFTMLALLYVACCFALMRDPWKFFSMAQTSVFAFVLCAVTQTKASEIYREPIQQLIEGSDYWMWCRTHQDMLEEEKHLREADVIEYIPWSTAAKSAVFVTGNNLQWKQISSANSLLGVNILMGAMTEITFFKEAGGGWTDEKIFNFYSKLKERISNRFQNNYYARVILDSSPSTLDDPIQYYMTYTAKKNPENMIWQGSRWDLYPGEFPEYCEVENPGTIYEKGIHKKNDYEHAFQLFKGGNGKPPQVCEDEAEASNFDPVDLIWCPIKQVTKKGTSNFKNKARENPIEFMKDWAGLPAGLPDRLFYRDDWVEDCFDNDLRNNYGSIIALADEEPEHLIWNQIKDKFFYDSMGQWRFYYEPHVPRVVSVDQSKSKDCTCISMSHVERDKEKIDLETGRPMLDYITDFTIVLVPKGGHINLDAIKYFIEDLKRLGNINLRHASFDGWQSDPARQYLKRVGITVDYVSVDSNNDPYYTFYDMVTHNRWFCGKNIFVKNNMKSLHEVRRKKTGSVKIEHFEGDLNYEWQEGTWLSCTAGINAKDATDAIAANLHLLSLYNTEFVPSKTWDPLAKVNRTYETVSAKNEILLKKMGYV